MKSIHFSNILFLTVFIGCSRSKSVDNEIKEIPWVAPIFTDNSADTLAILSPDQILSAENFIHYIGPNENELKNHVRTKHKDIYDSLNKEGLKIFVDTNGRLPLSFRFSNPFPNEKKYYQEFKFQSYPVFIYNPTKDTVFVEVQDNNVFMIQEAINESGKWEPIEYWSHAECGLSYKSINLNPDHLLVTQAVRYTGSFETKIRLKFRNGDFVVYSNIFEGAINKSQFESSNSDRKGQYSYHDFLNKNRFKPSINPERFMK